MATEREKMGRLVLEASTGVHGEVAKKLALELSAALAAPPVEQQAAEAPDEGQLDRWRSLSDALLRMDHRNMHFPTIREAAFQLQNAYIACRDLAKLPTAQPAPQAGAAESYEDLWNALQAIDTAAVSLPGFEVRHEGGIEAVTRNIVEAIQRVAAHPTEQPSQDAKDAAKWREHVGKLDALVAFCPTCCEGKVASADMTRDEVIFQCGRTSGKSEAARAAQAQGESNGGTPHG